MPDRPTVYLGQFTDDNAEKVTEALSDAGIEWWTKTSGRYTRMLFAGDWGVRVFVDADFHPQAVDIARQIAPHGLA